MRTCSYLEFIIFIAMSSKVFCYDETVEKKYNKRQIYREQVLPHAGGKIPDSAFETDRLFLNRLQTEGIAIPDGIVAQQRNPLVFPYNTRKGRTVYRVALTGDDRYISNEGRIFFQSPPSVETTYLFPEANRQPFRYPIFKSFELNRLQPKQNSYLYISPNVVATEKDSSSTRYKAQSERITTATLGNKQFTPEYATTNLFNHFDNLFNNFNLQERSAPYATKYV